MTTVTLNNGYQMPQIGLGCWKIDKSICADQIYEAIKVGYRLFDGAMDYGNEKEVGQGINRALKDGLVKREALFIVSKLWNNYHSPKNVEKAIAKVLQDLQLDYIDLFYIHFPIAQRFVPFEEKYPPTFYCGAGEDEFIFENVPIHVTWSAFEKLVDRGVVKSIGVSNFSGALIEDLLRGCSIKPQVVQIEHHCYLQQPRLIEYLKRVDIAITSYSSFGGESFLELEHPKAKSVGTLFKHPTILRIAKNHQVAPAKVLLRWITQRGICVIPKSNKKQRLLENLNVNDFDLTKNDFEDISKIDIGLRFNDPWAWNKIPTFL
ncbi:hypothetical protein DASC09_051910 [Saccharomycopsis crataegensis]|uniref:NADP-dependent oxidoreductase domain-containing protein n=1 Tax=Saccharomycopsis crataegensis TaxID=43959 RepID=A0AAV5QTK8_9ASCO|nr:hypothetical protein DASC09_051910 [Saccharomycopsis crataegensis]